MTGNLPSIGASSSDSGAPGEKCKEDRGGRRLAPRHQELAGHASLATTQRYDRGDTAAKRKVIGLI
jgi:hypothetical protein